MVNLGQSTENILVAGHRGICALYPENTMVSFRAALEADVDNIEMDLNVTRDGRLVVIHDTTLDRTTDKTGKVRDCTFDEIKSCDAGGKFDKKFKGEEGDEIDPATFMVYKLTNGYKTIERCNGKPMTPKMKNISLFNDKSIGIYINEDTLHIPELELIPILRGHKIGFIDSKARIVIEPVYDRFKGKFLDKYDYICVKQGGKWGVVDSEGGICLKTEYDYIIQGVVDYDLLPMDRDYLFTVCKEKQYAVFDNDARGGENCLVDFGKYDWIGGFDSRLAIVRKGNQYGMIDYSGALVLPVEYNHIDEFYNKGKTSTKAYKSGKEKTIKFSDLVCQGGYNDESYYGYSSGYNDSLSAYNNSYYNDALDFDQQSEDFWESL